MFLDFYTISRKDSWILDGIGQKKQAEHILRTNHRSGLSWRYIVQLRTELLTIFHVFVFQYNGYSVVVLKSIWAKTNLLVFLLFYFGYKNISTTFSRQLIFRDNLFAINFYLKTSSCFLQLDLTYWKQKIVGVYIEIRSRLQVCSNQCQPVTKRWDTLNTLIYCGVYFVSTVVFIYYPVLAIRWLRRITLNISLAIFGFIRKKIFPNKILWRIKLREVSSAKLQQAWRHRSILQNQKSETIWFAVKTVAISIQMVYM